jgi:transposase
MVMEGKPIPEVARELGIYAGNIYRWASELTKAGAELGSEGLGAVGAEPVADELRALRRENARLKMDNDILKKAAAILASYPPGNGGR